MTLSDGIARKCTFIVVDMELPFVLGLAFLKEHDAKVDFGSDQVQLTHWHVGQARSTSLTASSVPSKCKLSSMVQHARATYDSKPALASVFACSAK